MKRWQTDLALFVGMALWVVSISGCGGGPKEVVVYVALDQTISKPLFVEFTRETGIEVRPKFDSESTKTVDRLLAERDQPQCDVFWNNEILNTLRLERSDLLRSFQASAADQFPPAMRSPRGLWYGFAARGRVLIVNTNQISEERRPKTIRDLVDPQWYERCGIAKPLTGTTATHAACLFATWGDDEAKEFFLGVKRNARTMPGNKQVAQAVASGSLAFGLTDTDDAIMEIDRGMPVTIVYPDQGEGQIGTLFVPSTLAIIKDSPNPEAAEKLVDYLLSPEIERQLADGPCALIALREGVAASPRVKTPEEVRAMEIDWSAAVDKWDTAAEFLSGEFTGP